VSWVTELDPAWNRY